jgi:glycosyltransferase involved in cell wall biosynthesis
MNGDEVSIDTQQQRSLVIFSQVYVPDPAAVGQHVADVAEAMAGQGWRVVVYASSRGYDDPSVRYARREIRGGVDVRRLPLSSFGKRSLVTRLAAQTLFVLQATIAAFFIRKIDVILASTSPPFAGFFGAVLSAVRRRPLVWWVMDLNPDQLILSGTIGESSLPARVFDAMNRFTIRRCTSVVVLDRFMTERLLRKADVSNKLSVIPPWPHDHLMQEVPRGSNRFRRRHLSRAQRVVMYSGNHGVATPVAPLVRAAKALRDEPRLQFAFVGGGVLKASIDAEINAAGLINAVSLPYQALADLADSLSAGDVHVVSIADTAVGASHSCKIYNAMLLGKPILAIAPAESHVAEIVRSSDAGWVVAPGDDQALLAMLQMLAGMDDAELHARGRRGEDFVRKHFQREQLLGSFCSLLTASAKS